MTRQYSLLTLSLVLLSVVVPAFVNAHYYAKLVGGATHLDPEFGTLLGYYIFAEEGAVVTPAPVFELHTLFTDEKVHLLASNGRQTLAPHKASVSQTLTQGTTTMKWYVKSAPFGALPVTGPAQYESNADSQLTASGLRFDTPGLYNILFNVTFFDGSTFRFNQTITVNRQPYAITMTSSPAGYNGSVMDPPPTARMETFLGSPVATATPSVSIVVEAAPTGATFSGSTSLYPDVTGAVSFADLTPSLPGAYTFRLSALRSDGVVITTPSVRVVVEKALPVVINVLTGIGGVSSFRFFEVPTFSIRDSRGPSQDTRMNMTLSLEGEASLTYIDEVDPAFVGVSSVLPVNYVYSFPELAINLPGTYTVTAKLVLPTGSELVKTFFARITQAPTFEIPAPFTVNTIGTLSLFGDRPNVDPILLKLSSDASCVTAASDELSWTKVVPEPLVHNISIVPFQQNDLYVCMKLPRADWGALVQLYLQQFNEARPRVLTFSVAGVTSCAPLGGIEAARYRIAGWGEATEGRRYGCALEPPVAGTIPPCTCPGYLDCKEHRHPKFTPPNWDIGQCVCCSQLIMVLAGIGTAIVFSLLMLVIYFWV